MVIIQTTTRGCVSIRYLRPAIIALLAVVSIAGGALSGGPGARAQTTTIIQARDFWFCDSSFQYGVCETAVEVGDTVEWQWRGLHTTTECAGDLTTCPGPHLWDSPIQISGSFSFTFDTPGTYVYRCQIHPGSMRGQITVLAQPAPTPTPAPIAVGGIVELVAVADAPADASGFSSARDYAGPLALLAAGVVVALAAGGWYARRRWLQ